jgi:hypothetical protein
MVFIPTVMYVNDYDTSRLGLVVSRFEGAENAPERSDAVMGVFRRAGSVLLDGRPRLKERALLVEATMYHATVQARKAALKALLERLSRGTVEVRFIDEPLLVYRARLRRVTTTPPEQAQVIEASESVTLELECLDPYRYEVGMQLVALSATPVRLPLGDAPSPLLVRIFGVATDPVLTLRHANGTVLTSLGLVVTLGANDYMEIDCDRGTLVRYTAGVDSEAYDTLVSGDFLVADPQDGDGTLDGGPTLELSSGSGDARWKRCWT